MYISPGGFSEAILGGLEASMKLNLKMAGREFSRSRSRRGKGGGKADRKLRLVRGKPPITRFQHRGSEH